MYSTRMYNSQVDGRRLARGVEYGASGAVQGFENRRAVGLGAFRGAELGAKAGYQYGHNGLGQFGGGMRLGAAGLGGMGLGYEPVITVMVPWTQQFGMAYQQFVNGGYGGMGGMGGYGGMGGLGGGLGGLGGGLGGGLPMAGVANFGGMGGGLGGYGGGMGGLGGGMGQVVQGVPIGFGVTTY
ncbi:unnamed protein product [Adineta steineri]|uniref:Uncharacterized protein n=1 Tax=Adineta steineri TaxID=433720 RepID=A0A819T1Z9_9BILA|nr:unnamed protein product [Adineta steineri]CAF4068017.1 unnamed protein product [Adineta steineri]